MKLCFCFTVYEDWDLAKRLIKQLRMFPSAGVLCLTDGTHNPEFAYLCKIENIRYINGNRLHPQRYGGAWLKRFFYCFLSRSSADFLIRLEPDSFVVRPFNKPPNSDVAGNILVTPDGRRYIHGGCVLFRRSAVEKILNSSLLDNPEYATNSLFGYCRHQAPYLLPGEWPNSEVQGAHDVIFSDVVWKLGLHVSEWDEIYSRVRQACPEPHKYAVIHPVKTSERVREEARPSTPTRSR